MITIKNKQGFSLLELLLAIGIFSILITVVSGIYIAFSKTQTEVRASQRLLNDSQYAMEIMAREIRNNVIFDFEPTIADCNSFLGVNYNTCIILQREDKSLVAFTTYNNILYHIILTCNDDYSSCSWGTNQNDYTYLLSPYTNQVQVEDLDFYISPDVDPYQGAVDEQPRVTIKLKTRYYSTKVVEQVSHNLQTTVSSRIYRR
jgi:prepilin-type N-terminal cleavage/methylation domain-containing protein